MASGVAVTDECSTAYQEIKMGVNGVKKYRYVQFKISDDLKRVEVETRVEKGNPKDDFVEFGQQLPENDCRFAIYDHELTSTGDNVLRTQLFFIFWAPQSASVKKRMVYSSSKDAVMKKCGEATKPLQLNDKDDWNEADVESTCNKRV